MKTTRGGRKAAAVGPVRAVLSYALGTRAKVGCLRLLSTTGAAITQREVARRAGLQHRSVQLALDDLVLLGLVRRIEGGRDFLVSLSDAHHLSATVRELFRAESEFFLALRHDLAAHAGGAPRGARTSSLVLFGSVARGDDSLGSDVDLLVLTTATTGMERALGWFDSAGDLIRQRYGYTIRPIAYTVAEARSRLRRGEPPLPEIVRDHIVLAGPPLRELLAG